MFSRDVDEILSLALLNDDVESDNEATDHEETESEETEGVESQVEESSTETNEVVIPENDKGLTKKGLPRKRHKYDKTIGNRRIRLYKDKADQKLAMKPPCNGKCRRQCTTKISEEMRKQIHDCYVSFDSESRGMFIKELVEPQEVKKRKTKFRCKSRDVAYSYHFQVGDERIQVCKTFFLTTLGYKRRNDTHVYLTLKKEIDDLQEKRGKYLRKKKNSQGHVLNVNATISD
nr:uncharacterized protein LOC110379657 [Helicoverpa armigera]XP_049693220.1 uncharacterized protein LOC110379657 [Helicoverpa armigera]